jgi:hypothetical protein
MAVGRTGDIPTISWDAASRVLTRFFRRGKQRVRGADVGRVLLSVATPRTGEHRLSTTERSPNGTGCRYSR